jgi:hypothetical protein
MGKRKKSLPPRRKRMKRAGRLRNARSTNWVENCTSKDLVKGYRNWYGTDALTAVVELRMLGVAISEFMQNPTVEQATGVADALADKVSMLS